MAKTTDFLSQTSGKLTDQFVTRQTAHGTILARAPKKTSNPRRSERQANMRCQLANMSANFKLYQGKLKLAWESKKAGLSEYNCFVASNYDKNPVYITKSMRVAGACVLAESYISNGSLPPIDAVVNGSGALVSDLSLGGLVIDAQTTVADLTMAILQNNAEWEDGDQLTWFYGVQRVDSAGTPRASLTAEKVVLDTTNENPLWGVVSAVGFSSVGGYLGMSQALVNAGGVWVHSREKDSGSIKVSSQQMTVVSDVLAQYQTYAAMKASADSYGGINVSVAYLKPETLASISSQSGGSQSGGSSSGSSGSNESGGNSGGGSNTGGNTGGVTQTVNAPTFSGETQFETSTTVTMTAESGAEIRYTTNGSTPTASSTLYSAPVTLTETTTVKAIAIKNGVSSSVTERTYTKSAGNGGGEELGGDDH